MCPYSMTFRTKKKKQVKKYNREFVVKLYLEKH